MPKALNILKGDKGLWIVCILLSIISLVAVFSASGLTANTHSSTPMRFFVKHLVFVVAAYVIAIGVSFVNYRKLSKWSLWLLLAVLVLLVYVAMSHTRWIKLPLIGRFQPSELAKVLVVMVTARQLALQKDEVDDPGVFKRVSLTVCAVAGVVLFDNFSMAALVFITCFTLMYFGGVNRKWWLRVMLACMLLVGGGLGYFATHEGVEVGRSTTWVHRIDTWMHPNPNELSQENIARMAIASGGLTGNGVGSTVHARLMTEAHNDFIFAIIIEEMGAWFGIFIFVLYSILFMRCIRTARNCRGRFGSLMVLGLGILIYYQALVNMCVAVGALPVTGQTLPLISYGGTAYLCMGIIIGAIQSVARDNTRKAQQQTAAAGQQSSIETPGEADFGEQTLSENQNTVQS